MDQQYEVCSFCAFANEHFTSQSQQILILVFVFSGTLANNLHNT